MYIGIRIYIYILAWIRLDAKYLPFLEIGHHDWAIATFKCCCNGP